MDKTIIKAMESVVRLGVILMAKAVENEQLTPTQIIACDGLVKPWVPGQFKRGDIRTDGGQTWKCVQDHDSTQNPAWTPEATRALWVPFHTKDPAQARPYIQPTMAEDAYYTGECALWTDGKVKRANRDAVVHDPDTLPEAWDDMEV